jgi:predicted RNase H-like HicB family nuclease
VKAVYPVIITETTDKKIPYLVHVPDFGRQTQGKDLADAIFMAEDLISLTGVAMQDDGEEIPPPSKASDIDSMTSPWHDGPDAENDIVGETVTLIPVDFDAYRKKYEQRTVRRNVSLPAWLDHEAARAGINVSATLQEALRERLGF